MCARSSTRASQTSSFFFDKDRHKTLSLGTWSALQEIELCKQRGLAYWFPDGYVHSQPSMSYKARFQVCVVISVV